MENTAYHAGCHYFSPVKSIQSTGLLTSTYHGYCDIANILIIFHEILFASVCVYMKLVSKMQFVEK